MGFITKNGTIETHEYDVLVIYSHNASHKLEFGWVRQEQWHIPLYKITCFTLGKSVLWTCTCLYWLSVIQEFPLLIGIFRDWTGLIELRCFTSFIRDFLLLSILRLERGETHSAQSPQSSRRYLKISIVYIRPIYLHFCFVLSLLSASPDSLNGLLKKSVLSL